MKKTITADTLRSMPVSKRRRAFDRLSPEQQAAVTVPCTGEAHTNPFIDSCSCCMNYSWGHMLAPQS